MPAYVHLIDVDVVPAQAAQEHSTEQAHAAHGQDRLVRGPDDFLTQGAEEVVVVGTRAQARLLNDLVDVTEAQVVFRGDVQLGGATLDEFRGGALARFQAAFDGRREIIE